MLKAYKYRIYPNLEQREYTTYFNFNNLNN